MPKTTLLSPSGQTPLDIEAMADAAHNEVVKLQARVVSGGATRRELAELNRSQAEAEWLREMAVLMGSPQPH